MPFKMLIACIVFAIIFDLSLGLEASFQLKELNSRIEKGRDEITKLHQRAMLPKGGCWKDALQELEVQCEAISPENQSRLAFKFTSCFNEILGLPPIVCEQRTVLSECMEHLKGSNFDTFRDFFLHTQDMCYYLQHQLWHEKTSQAVNDVTNAVLETTKNIHETKETQENILQSQLESLKIQGDLVKENNALHDMVLSSKEVWEEVQVSAIEQRQVFVEIFDKLTRMQTLVSWIQGEMSLLDMMGFYFASMIFGFFCTASERTRKVRFWIVILMILAIGLERSVFNFLNEHMYSPEKIQEWIWFIRRSSAITGATIIIWGAAKYRDPQITQLDMLTVVNRRMDMVMEYMKEANKTIKLLASKGGITAPQAIGCLKDDGEQEVSDADTYSNYSKDSESDEEMNIVEPECKYNDENRIPETDEYAPKSFGQRVRKRSVLREASVDRSINRNQSSNHTYNLRTKKASAESRESSFFESESPSQFARQVKTTKRGPTVPNRATQYYSSDEEM